MLVIVLHRIHHIILNHSIAGGSSDNSSSSSDSSSASALTDLQNKMLPAYVSFSCQDGECSDGEDNEGDLVDAAPEPKEPGNHVETAGC